MFKDSTKTEAHTALPSQLEEQQETNSGSQ